MSISGQRPNQLVGDVPSDSGNALPRSELPSALVHQLSNISRRFIERAKQTTHQTSYVWPSCFSSVAYKCKSGRVIRSAQARSLWRAPAARWNASQPPRDDSDGLLLLLILSLSLLLPMLLFRQAVTMEATPERRGFESSCCCLFSIASPLPLPPAVVTMGTLLDDGWVASSIKRRP